MGYRRMKKRDLWKIYRRWQAGQSVSHISVNERRDCKTVRNYLQGFESLGLVPSGTSMEEHQFYEVVQKLLPTRKKRSAPASDQLLPHVDELRKLINRANEALKPKAAFLLVRSKYELSVSYATFKRFARQQEHIRKLQQEETPEFVFSAPLECVQVDRLYTVAVPDSMGRQRQAILLTFLDDATRRVLYASFGFTENSLAIDCGIKHVLKAHGKIGRLCVNNEAAFVSVQTQRVIDTLGIIYLHSRVGRPCGCRKVERFHRTIREQFLRPMDPQTLTSLEDLDSRVHSWLESEYHRSPQRGLKGKTPLEAWIENIRFIVPMHAEVDLDRLFLHEVRPRRSSGNG